MAFKTIIGIISILVFPNAVRVRLWSYLPNPLTLCEKKKNKNHFRSHVVDQS